MFIYVCLQCLCTDMFIYTCIHYIVMFYVISTQIKIIFDISTSNNVRISNIYAKKHEIGVEPQVNIYQFSFHASPKA